MEQKNRLLIAAAIVALIVGAMLTSFGRVLFAVKTPEVVLPSSSAGPGDLSGGDSAGQCYQRLEVTPETVAGVTATLARPVSYYRELTVESFWDGGSSTAQVQVWADGGWSHSVQALPSGAVRHDLTDGETLYYWYEGDEAYQTAPADQFSSDLAQHIPTYETVTELDPSEISAAGYELRGDLPCVWVEVRPGFSGLTWRYWVDVGTGLLVSAEAEEEGQPAYRMTAYSPIHSPCPADGDFSLPDGTVLHTVGE